jgi:hypothetical protein
MREEFGVPRTSCTCITCVNKCAKMPGCLIPADLTRMIPKNVDPYRWSEENLLASPGALVTKDGKLFRIPTLVPAIQADGACINLTDDLRCKIHDLAPFGCAFFSCAPEVPGLVDKVLVEIYKSWQDVTNLYPSLHIHLSYKGFTQRAPEELRAEMRG